VGQFGSLIVSQAENERSEYFRNVLVQDVGRDPRSRRMTHNAAKKKTARSGNAPYTHLLPLLGGFNLVD